MKNKKSKVLFPFKYGVCFMLLLLFFTETIIILQSQEFQSAFSNQSGMSLGDFIYKSIVSDSVPAIGQSKDSPSHSISVIDIIGLMASTLKNDVLPVDNSTPPSGSVSSLGSASVSGKISADLTQNDYESDDSGSSETPPPLVSSSETATLPIIDSRFNNKKPYIIIYHTHTTESFSESKKYTYTMANAYRSVDRNYSVCRLGQEIQNYIESNYSYGVVHDQTYHDYPTYDGSYSRSIVTIRNILKQYSSPKLIIDLHRDAFPDVSGTKKSMTVKISNEDAAKIMIIIGKSNPNWKKNFDLASKLNDKINKLYPGLSRGVVAVNNRVYNQQVSNKMILIELGGDCNTLDEALVSSRLVGKAIGELMKSL